MVFVLLVVMVFSPINTAEQDFTSSNATSLREALEIMGSEDVNQLP